MTNAPPASRLVNRTPHPITFYVGDDPVVTIPPTAPPIRVPESAAEIGRVEVVLGADFVPLLEVVPKAFPASTEAEMDNVVRLVIVSREVARAYPERRDLVFPHSLVRDEMGRTIGCRALGQFGSAAAERPCRDNDVS